MAFRCKKLEIAINIMNLDKFVRNVTLLLPLCQVRTWEVIASLLLLTACCVIGFKLLKKLV